MLELIQNVAAKSQIPSVDRHRKGRECYAFSEIEDQVFEYIREEAQGLFEKWGTPIGDYEITTDAIGNMFVTVFGRNRGETVMSGSHVDSVLRGGDFDGVAGVNSAFNFLKKVIEAGRKPEKNYTFAVFRSEESSPKTGATFIGSRVATGTISAQEINRIPYKLDDGSAITLREYFERKYEDGAQRWEAVLAELTNPPIHKDQVIAYEELHIEQSAVCEVNDVDLGIVIDGIGGAIRQTVGVPLKTDLVRELNVSAENPHHRYVLRFVGEEAHTGGTPPNLSETKAGSSNLWYRKDALVAAAPYPAAGIL